MNLIEMMIAILIIVFVFSFSSVLFWNSIANINLFWDHLQTHTKKISQISYFEVDTWNCVETVFTWYFLTDSLTGYFCKTWEIFNWYLKG